jgi:hypothetical protein
MTGVAAPKKPALQNLYGQYLQFQAGAFTTPELCGADRVCA